MIPNRLFQTWKVQALPDNFAYWRQSFFACNPEFEILLFDDADNRAFVERHLPAFLGIYDAFPKEIYRADAVRPLYLFFQGGFYADLDFECLQPLNRYSACETVILGSMGVDPEFEHSIPNAMLASPQYEAFWLLYLSEIVKRSPRAHQLRPEYTTGPVVLRETLQQYNQNPDAARDSIARFIYQYQVAVDPALIRYSPVQVLPGIEWYPFDWSDHFHQTFRLQLMASKRILPREEVQHLFPRSVAVTYWSHSWESEKPKRKSLKKRTKAWLARQWGVFRGGG